MTRVARIFSQSGVYHILVGKMSLKITDSKKILDEDAILLLNKQYHIDNSKRIKLYQKCASLSGHTHDKKKKYTIRQLERVTGVSRGVIGKKLIKWVRPLLSRLL